MPAMNKDFNQEKLLSFKAEKVFRILYDLAFFIEKERHDTGSNHFAKLSKYHHYLKDHQNPLILKLNKEFQKIKNIDYQFQVYLMTLERLLGQSKKEYDFLVQTQVVQNTPEQKFSIQCVLDSIRSAHNIGAMIRNADCFHIEKLILTGLSPSPQHHQVIKTAMGAEKNVRVENHNCAIDIVKELKSQGHQIWAIETGREAISINSITERPSPLTLLFGHEQFGLSLELLQLADKIISIPMFGVKNSLNVSISQGIILNKLTSL